VVSLPIIIAANNQLEDAGLFTVLGTLMWISGFIIEATADRQLAHYLQLADRPKVLQMGLWKYSRHPNYFGELLQWWGIACIALQVSNGWLGLIGPLTLSLLIIFVSGIPPIENHRARDPEYRKYQQRTSALVLWLPRTNR
jgi:steroid 5-alpha reductase family enzyme